jgi:hypothetical protein
MPRAWLVVLILVSCSRSPEKARGGPASSAGSAGSGVAPRVTRAVPTISTLTVPELLSQSSGGGSAWSLRHVRVYGVLAAVERDDHTCITAVTIEGGVKCVLVDPSPVPLHVATTVDGQVDVEGNAHTLVHCRVMAPTSGSAALEPACLSASP